MGEFSELTIKILFLFLPGIIYCLIYEKLTFNPDKEFNYFIIHSFIFGIISYFIYGIYLCFRGQSLEDIHFLTDLLSTGAKQIHVNEIFAASIIGCLLALFITWMKNQRVLYNIFRKNSYKQFIIEEEKNIKFFWVNKNINIKRPDFVNILRFLNPIKVFDNDVWNNIFNNNEDEYKWVLVKDHILNLKYEGWVYKFSDSVKNNELFLKDVIVSNIENIELYRTPGLYITRKKDDITIEFFAIKPTNLIDRYKEEEYANTRR